MENPKLQQFIKSLKGLKGGSGKWTSFCPKHEADGGVHNPSLSIKHDDATGTIYLNCFNGCCGKQIMMAAGFNPSDMYMPRQSEPRQQITAEYDYFDPAGVFAFQIVRMEPGKNGKSKDFRQRRKDALTGKWTWSTTGITKYPYRLTEMLAADPEIPVIITEGEKGTDYCRAKWPGVPVVCNPGGAGRWLKSYGKYFKGRIVVVVPDADLPNPQTGKMVGNIHAKEICDNLLDHAAEVYMFEPPGMKPKWGLDDWVKANEITLDRFETYVEKLQPWGPTSQIETKQPLPHELDEDGQVLSPVRCAQKLLAEVGLSCFGAIVDKSSTKVALHGVNNHRSLLINTDKITYGAVASLAGSAYILKVSRRYEESDRIEHETIEDAIHTVAAEISINASNRYGIGFWHDGKQTYFIGQSYFELLENKLTKHNNPPQIGDRVPFLDYSDSISSKGMLEDSVKRMQSVESRVAVLEDLRKKLSQWDNIAHPESILWLSLFVIALPGQSIWEWRPWLILLGQSDTGKTEIQKFIHRLFGAISFLTGDATPAAIINKMGCNSLIMLLDELEKSPHRAAIMSMLMNMNRDSGASRIRSNKGQGVEELNIQGMPVISSTERQALKETEINRMVVFQFHRLAEQNIEKFRTYSEAELLPLRHDIFGITMVCGLRILELTFVLKRKYRKCRQTESYILAASVYGAIHGLSDDEAGQWFEQRLPQLQAEAFEEHDSEGEMTLDRILNQQMLSIGVRLRDLISGNVSTGVSRDANWRRNQLRRCGVVVMSNKRAKEMKGFTSISVPKRFHSERYVFFDTSTGSSLRETILKNHDLGSLNLKDLLIQVPGSFQCSLRVNRKSRGIALPMSAVEENLHAESSAEMDGADTDEETTAQGQFDFIQGV